MKNPGHNPYANEDNSPMVDVIYRNRLVSRSINPNQRRWKPWKPGYEGQWDIVSYQPSGEINQ